MSKIKFFFSIFIFAFFILGTSIIKNETREIEKSIYILNKIVQIKEKDLNEAQLDFYYLTSPAELEKKLGIIGLDNYQPIEYSKIFFEISDFNNIQSKISKLKSK